MSVRLSVRAFLANPARVIVVVFLSAVVVGTGLLMLPISTEGGGGAPPLVALFTATSAVCVTGLVVVETGQYWSPFGQAIILALIQAGGFGIMTGATFLLAVAGRRIDRRLRRTALAEMTPLQASDVYRLLRLAAIVTITAEILIALVLWARFWIDGRHPGAAAWDGVFHAISAFNNAGFDLFGNSLVGAAGDPFILLVVAGAVVVGGLGLPVWDAIRRRRETGEPLALHARVMLWGTLALIVIGSLSIGAAEWTNDSTLGRVGAGERSVLTLFTAIMPRTAGFNAIDYGAARDETLLITDLLMFVGAGSGSTAGGVKVTTVVVLLLVVWSELRGRADIGAFRRRLPIPVVRAALAITVLAGMVIVVCTLVVEGSSDLGLTASAFESISAFSTVGLSTGVTADLPPVAKCAIIATMIIGRIGPFTLAFALILRAAAPTHRYPEERVLVG